MANLSGMKRIFGNFASSTSMHGIGSVSSARSLKVRIFWSIVCLSSMGMFLYMLSIIVKQYLAFPTVVNVEEVSISFITFHTNDHRHSTNISIRPLQIDFMFYIQNLCESDARTRRELHKINTIAQTF